MTFNESNTAEACICDLLKSIGWTLVDIDTFVPQQHNFLVESDLREALFRLNFAIAAWPELAYKAIRRLLTVHDHWSQPPSQNYPEVHYGY